MNIKFEQIMPKPLVSMEHHENSIWGKSVNFEKGKKNMLNASSGKGKSTFTHIVIGLRKDFTGKLLFEEKDTSFFSPNDWTTIRKEKIAIVYQDLQLFYNLTVKENLEMKNKLCAVYSENELKEMLKLLEIENKWNQTCGLLSMGQQQRVAIIRALCQPFEYLILDEPFSHLDKENAHRALNLIDKRCDDLKAGFVLTTLGEDYGFSFDYEFKL